MAGVSASASASAVTADSRPNILLLFPDQWRYDWDGWERENQKGVPGEMLRLPHTKAVAAKGPDFTKEMTLWRGMANVHVLEEFKTSGGTELAPMSTSASKSAAFGYAKSEVPLVFRYDTKGLTRGASINYLSVYPGEDEFLYRPLTYICYKKQETLDGVTVVIVEPQNA